MKKIVNFILVTVEQFSRLGTGYEKYTLNVTGYEFDKSREFYVIKLLQPIVKGDKYRVTIDFVSKLNNGLSGFYRSSYINENGKKE